MASPRLYSTFLLWLLSELFEQLPEVGDQPKPKLCFFFDEAHLLFDEAPKPLLEKIEQVVRLIRSKGIGVYFITQNPIDIPDTADPATFLIYNGTIAQGTNALNKTGAAILALSGVSTGSGPLNIQR